MTNGAAAQAREEWRGLVSTVAERMIITGEGRGWAPDESSVFEHDRIAAGVYAPYAHGVPLIVATVDYLTGLATLLADQEFLVWAPYPLARSCLEIGARTWWMLDPDQTISCRNRRAYELLRVAVYANRAMSDGFSRQRRQYQQALKRELARYGISSTTRGDAITAIHGVRLPGFLELVQDLLHDREFGADVYSWLSGVGHGGLDALREGMQMANMDERTGQIVFASRASDIAVASYGATVAALAMFDRWSRLCAWVEWRAWSIHLWVRADHLLRRFITLD